MYALIDIIMIIIIILILEATVVIFMHLLSYSQCVLLSFVLYTVDSESSDSDDQFSDNDQQGGAYRNDNDSTVTDDKCHDASNSCGSGK